MPTRSQVEQARHELDLALKQVSQSLAAKGNKISFSIGRITFNSDEMRCKLVGVSATAGASGVATVTPEMAALKRNAWLLGANVDITKTYDGGMSLGKFKFVGYKRQAKKYPFVVQTTAGKRYKITSFSAKQYVANGAVA